MIKIIFLENPVAKETGSKERKERGMILEMKVKRPERPILFKQALFKKKNKVGGGQRDWELSAQMQINNKMARVQNYPDITLGQKEMFVVGLGRFKVSWCVQSSVILNGPSPQWPSVGIELPSLTSSAFKQKFRFLYWLVTVIILHNAFASCC